MAAQAIFAHSDGRYVASEFARGPWDRDAQHGGAPAALIMRALERLPAAEGLMISRVTYEFLRPVPLGELTVSADVVRPGRRVQLLEAVLRAPDGVEVVRARAAQVQRAVESVPATPQDGLPPGPEHAHESDFVPPHSPMFAPDSVEVRFLAGEFGGGGPAVAWFRLRRPLLAGEEPSPLQRLAVAGDFGNGISASVSWERFLFINPDLTLYIEREPVGEWICLDSRTVIASGGIGTAESVLYDEHGRIGRAIQALLIAAR